MAAAWLICYADGHQHDQFFNHDAAVSVVAVIHASHLRFCRAGVVALHFPLEVGGGFERWNIKKDEKTSGHRRLAARSGSNIMLVATDLPQLCAVPLHLIRKGPLRAAQRFGDCPIRDLIVLLP